MKDKGLPVADVAKICVVSKRMVIRCSRRRTVCPTECGGSMPEDRNGELKKLMKDRGLLAADVAEICAVSKRTVMRWLQAKDSATYVVMPVMSLRWLKLTVASK